MNKDRVRLRFAPSPTGFLHIGSLRTALFNYLFARHHQGTFLLRIEDTDKERSLQQYTDMIFATLAWCGIVPDEPIVIQSSRYAEHTAVANKLLAQGKAYRCYCPQTSDGTGYQQYNGHCKNLPLQPDKSFVIRFAIPDTLDSIVVDDQIKGKITFARDTLDDFIIVRSDGIPVYNFVVVVDDAYMRITHVIRGEEHLINTPKQMLLYQACGYELPIFAHLPLILGPDGTKMSKRDTAANVYDYKARGYLPVAICNYLVRLGWSHGDQEIFSWQEMIDYFSLAPIAQKGALFDAQKLEWVNATHIKQSQAVQLYEYLIHTMRYPVLTQLSGWSLQTVYHAIDLFKQRVKTMGDLWLQLIQLHTRPTYEQLPAITESEQKIITNVESVIVDATFDKDHLARAIKQFSLDQNVTMHELAPLIRRALVGVEHAPSVVDMMLILGAQETVARLRAYTERGEMR